MSGCVASGGDPSWHHAVGIEHRLHRTKRRQDARQLIGIPQLELEVHDRNLVVASVGVTGRYAHMVVGQQAHHISKQSVTVQAANLNRYEEAAAKGMVPFDVDDPAARCRRKLDCVGAIVTMD